MRQPYVLNSQSEEKIIRAWKIWDKSAHKRAAGMLEPHDEEPGGTGLGLHRSQSIPSEVTTRDCNATTRDVRSDESWSLRE